MKLFILPSNNNNNKLYLNTVFIRQSESGLMLTVLEILADLFRVSPQNRNERAETH